MSKKVYLLQNNLQENCYHTLKYDVFIKKLGKKSFTNKKKYDKYRSLLVNVNWLGLPNLYVLMDIDKLQNFSIEKLQTNTAVSKDKEYLDFFICRNTKDCPVIDTTTKKISIKSLNYDWWIGLYASMQVFKFMNTLYLEDLEAQCYDIGFGPNIDIEDPDYNLEKLDFESKLSTDKIIIIDNDIFMRFGKSNLYYKFTNSLYKKLCTKLESNFIYIG